jgi:tetratricopeptide (TPR) repeat protein
MSTHARCIGVVLVSVSHDRFQDGATRPTGGPVRLGSKEAKASNIPDVLAGRYEIGAAIGEGGAGRVFRAWDRVLGEEVAIKILRPDLAANARWIRRLAREVKVARAIRHPNVCRVFDFGWADGLCFITMELAANGTLRDVVERLRASAGPGAADPEPLWAERLAAARALCAGLAAIHAVGISHRDVTPQNVLVMSDGRVVLSDFGLAVAKHESTTFHGGTPSYMAPEVLAGERADQRSDVWQLGMVLHEVLFGCRPTWAHEGDRVLLKSPVERVATAVAEATASLCAACLAHDPRARPENAVTVAGLLAAAQHARPRSRAARAWARAKRLARYPAARIVVATAIVALVAGESARVALRPRLCRGDRERVAGVWDAPQKEAARRAFIATGRPHATTVFTAVSQKLDEYLIRWQASYRQACEATYVHGEQSSEILDLRLSCLNTDLENARALARAFPRADSNVVDSALMATTALPDFARCSNLRELRLGVPAPTDPHVRQAVDEVRQRIANVNSLAHIRKEFEALTASEGLVESARSTGYCPVLAEAQAARGVIEVIFILPESTATLESAVWTAESCGDDRVVALASIFLTFPRSSYLDLPAADHWASLARAALRRLGGDPMLESWLLNDWGGLLFMRGDCSAAEEPTRQSIALKKSVLGPDHPDVAGGIGNLALLMSASGHIAEADELNEHALAIFRKWTGEESVDAAMYLGNHGDNLLALGHPKEARQAYQKVMDIFDRHHVTGSQLAFPLAGLARISLESGDLPKAMDLLQRAAPLSAHMSEQYVNASITFTLARVLYASHKRDQARALAEKALAIYSRFQCFDAQKREIREWLAGPKRRAAQQ